MLIKPFENSVLIISIVLLTGLTISIVSSLLLLKYSRQQNKIQIERNVESRAEQLQLSINNTVQNLESLAALFYSNQNVSQNQFNKFIGAQNRNSILSLAWVPLVKDINRSKFENTISGKGMRGKHIYDINSHGLISIAYRQFKYYPIQYLSSDINTELFPGLNLGTHYKTKKKFSDAAKSNQTLVTQRITLQNRASGLSIVRAFKPIYSESLKKEESLKGFVLAEIDIKALMETVFGKEDDLSIILFDINANTNHQILYRNQLPSQTHPIIHSINDLSELEDFFWSRYYSIGDRSWLVAFISNGNNSQLVWLPFLGLITGLLFTSFLTIYMLIAWKKAQQVNQLKKENSAKNRFLQAVGHDLRQPLNLIGLHISNYEEKNNSIKPENQALLSNIRQSISGLHTMFTSLLDISRLEEDLIKPEFTDVKLKPLFTDLGDEYDLIADEKNLEFRMRCQDIIIHTDKILLERVLRNLLNNAIKYTDNGKIFLGARKINNQLKIYIMDTGRGINNLEIESIFDSYKRGSNTGDIDGIGLGLSIVKQTLDLIKLKLMISSKPNIGTQIIITNIN